VAEEIADHIGLLPQHEDILDAMEADGASQEEIDRRAEEPLDYRADMIARSETIYASYAGERETWRQADDLGLLPDTAVQEWIAEGDACEICAPLDGATAALDEPFDGDIYQPGDPHPNSRCAVVMRPYGVDSEE
jgi:hypothetical protein